MQPAQLPGQHERSSVVDALHRDRGELLGAVGRCCAEHQAGPKGPELQYKNVGAPGSVIGSGDGVQWSGTLSPAIPPQVTGVTPGASPAGGYLPLSAFGITPIAGVGDDTITNFNVPQFFYGGEPYTSLGVVSNGYLVLGGGTSADIVFTPQHFPNAARPNNVVAPLWSDLNPTASPGGGSPHRNADGRLEHLDRRRLAEDQELRQRHDPLVRDLDPDRQRRRRDRALERGRVLDRTARAPMPATPAPVTRTRARTGAPRTVTARAARTSPPLRPTAPSTRSTRRLPPRAAP